MFSGISKTVFGNWGIVWVIMAKIAVAQETAHGRSDLLYPEQFQKGLQAIRSSALSKLASISMEFLQVVEWEHSQAPMNNFLEVYDSWISAVVLVVLLTVMTQITLLRDPLMYRSGELSNDPCLLLVCSMRKWEMLSSFMVSCMVNSHTFFNIFYVNVTPRMTWNAFLGNSSSWCHLRH